MSEQIPVVLIAVESDDKGGQSPERQLEELRNYPPVLEGGRFIVGEFKESGKSGWKRERGPETQAGLDRAVEAAAEYGHAEVWVFHTSRLARGDGTKGKRSFLKIYADLLYENVQVRTKEDDEYATRPMLVGIASENNNKYGDALSVHVSSAKRLQRQEGLRSGGPLPDGFLYESRIPHPHNDRRVLCTYRLDPEREHIYRAMFDGFFVHGHSESKIAKDLNAAGYRTKAGTTKKGKPKGGNPFSFKSVQRVFETPFFFGGNGWDVGKPTETITWDDHEGYGSQDQFFAYRKHREDKGHGQAFPGGGVGRPNERYVLGSGFARCGRCGSTISTHTDTYVRKDGTRKRNYFCKNVKHATGTCDLPKLDAERIDRELVEHLSKVWVDFEAFVERVQGAQTGEVEKVERERDEAAKALSEFEGRSKKLRKVYADHIAADEVAEAGVVMRTLTDLEEEGEDAARRVQALSGRLAEVVATTPVDESLDALSALRDELRGTLGKGTVREVREGLERRFATFILDRDEDGADTVTPILKRLPVYASWGQPLEGEEIPTHALVTIGPDENGSDSWESLHAVPD